MSMTATETNTAFCRTLLRALRRDMKRAKTKRPTGCYTYRDTFQSWEFHAADFYWYGSAHNAFEARYNGIQAWLREHDPAGWERLNALDTL